MSLDIRPAVGKYGSPEDPSAWCARIIHEGLFPVTEEQHTAVRATVPASHHGIIVWEQERRAKARAAGCIVGTPEYTARMHAIR